MKKTKGNKIIKLGLFVFIIFIIFIQCTKLPEKVELFKWETSLDLFIAKVSITADSIFSMTGMDSLISVETYPNGDGSEDWYVFRDTIEIDTISIEDELAFDDFDPQSFTQSVENISIDPMNESVSKKIGNMTLDDIDPIATPNIRMVDMFPYMNSMSDGDTIFVNQATPIPAAPVYRDVDFGSFTEATFSSGTIELELVNDLVVEIGEPLKIYLLTADSSYIVGTDGDTAMAEYSPGVLAGNTKTESIDLANKTLPGTIITKMIGAICGSEKDTIIVNTASKNSSFVINASVNNLEVISVVGDIPSQTIEDSALVDIDISNSNKIQSATINSGELEINIINGLPVDTKFILTLENLKTPANLAFSTDTITATKNNNSNNSWAIDNYKIEFEDINNPEMSYNYTVRTLSENDATIHSTDSIQIEVKLHGDTDTDGISFSQITGKFSMESMEIIDSIEIDQPTKITNADFSSGTIAMNIVNNLGISANINYQINEIISNSGDTLKSTITLDGTSTPVNDITLLDDYNIVFSNPTPGESQVIHYSSSVELDSSIIQTLYLEDSISVEIQMTDLNFASVSGIVDSMEIEIPSTGTSIEGIPEELEGINLSNIEMKINLVNGINIPIWLNLKVSAYNEDNNDSAIINISQNITDNPTINIEDYGNPEDLVNIFPDSIIVSGSALINGAGTIDITQAITGNLMFGLPLQFTIGDSVFMKLDPQEIDSVSDIPDGMTGSITANVDNKFEFGAEANLYFANDSADFTNSFNDTNKVHHLITFNIEPLDTATNILSLSEKNTDLFRGGGFIKYDVLLKGRNDGEPSTFLSNDSLIITLHGTVSALIDIDSLSQGGE